MSSTTPNNTLAVVSQTGESLSFFSLSNFQQTGDILNLTAEPHELAYDDRTNLLYITHAYRHGWYGGHGEDGHEITVVDCAPDHERKVVDVVDISPGKGPHYCLLDKPRELLYVCVEGGLNGHEEKAGGILAVDLGTRKVVKQIGSGWKAHWFVLTPDGKRAYTCHKEADFVSVLDLVEDKLIAKIEMVDGCEQPSISRDGRFVYYPTPTMTVSLKRKGGPYSVKVVDTCTNSIIHSIPIEFGALTTHVDAKDRLLVGQYRIDHSIMQNTNGQLLVLSGPSYDFAGNSWAELAKVEVAKGPLTVFSTSDASMAFAACTASGVVSVIDMERFKVRKPLEVDTVVAEGKKMLCGAHGMAIVP